MKKLIVFFVFLMVGGCFTLKAQNPGDPGYCEDVSPGYVYYLKDGDGDGYSDGTGQCAPPGSPPNGFFLYDFRKLGDCNDNNPGIYPRLWYFDNDGDGYGTIFSERLCTGPNAPDGYADNNNDCDDTDSNLTLVRDWYQDQDNDSYGDTASKVTACEPPAGMVNPVNRGGDYDDTDALITNIPPMNYYYDGDGDTYGLASNVVFQSVAPNNYVDRSGDCNDNDATLNPETVWYFDSDGDGLGASGPNDLMQCTPPTAPNYVRNKEDLCPDEFANTSNGCIDDSPKEVTERDRNWVWSLNYDADGNIKGNSIGYFDEFGKPIQSQTLDIKTGRTWANQTFYDQKGRQALQTLSAPIGFASSFTFKDNFVQTSGGQAYSVSNFDTDKENPAAVGAQSESLGWYYSTNNDREPYQDITSYPFTRSIHSELMPGTVLRSLGGNKIDSNGDGSITGADRWVTAYTFSMQAPAAELAVVAAFGSGFDSNTELIKTVSRDPHGEENISYTDTDGQVLAAARSGGTSTTSVTLPIGAQGYVDVHVPQGLSGLTISNTGAITVYDRITELVVNGGYGSLPNGFYRIAVNDLSAYTANSITVTYQLNYYDFSLNVYDRADRLVTSYQPVGSSLASKPQSSFTYKASGHLVESQSPDEGTAQFVYRGDGQIRFSQNSKQVLANEVSYTNYDIYGRPEESGVAIGLNFTSLGPISDAGSNRKDQVFTIYDGIPANIDVNTALPVGYREPSYLSGNVAITKNDHNTTYYSYDVYGRVKWMVQDIEFLGIKTLDYAYDPFTGLVTKVTYQKDTPAERFIHRYNYNEADQLVQVETSLDGASWEIHATYDYYESDEMKRTVMAGVQGVDYLYNIAGQLKAINPPGQAEPTGRPDLFRMQLDYHTNDYQRPGANIAPQNYGENRFDGTIKGNRWTNANSPEEAVYGYDYDRNNWLTSADFGADGIPQGPEPDPLTLVDEVVNDGEQEDYENGVRIKVLPESHFKFGSTVSLKIRPAAAVGGPFDVSGITYDANGNIKSLVRNKGEDNDGTAMDQLSYRYDPNRPNRLLQVADAVGEVSGADDLGTQVGDENDNNYRYNAIGQLVEDWEQVTEAEKQIYLNTGAEPDGVVKYAYNASGLVTQVSKNNLPLVKFFYNDRNHRVRKESFDEEGNAEGRTYYVRDAAGQAMAILLTDNNGSPLAEEYPVYGANRIGIFKRSGNTGVTYYELTDHLGNVRTVFSKAGTNPAMQGYSDYFPFGMQMPGRNIVGDYRYAYQGQYAEKDDETGLNAFELRMYDSRIGRWISPDPYGQYASPYVGMGNDWPNGIDPDGGWKGLFGKWRARRARNRAIEAGLDPGELYKSGKEWGFNTTTVTDAYTTDANAIATFNISDAWTNSIPAQIIQQDKTWVDGWAESGNMFAQASYGIANSFSIVGQSLNPFDEQITTLTGENRTGMDNSYYGAEAAATLLPIGSAGQGIKSLSLLKSPLVFRNVGLKTGLGETTFRIGIRHPPSNFMIRLERDMVQARVGPPFKSTHINIHQPGKYNYHIRLNPFKWFR